LEQRQALLAIDLPGTFSRDLAAGRRAPMQVLVDGRRANAGQLALGYVDSVATQLGARATGSVDADALAVRHWFNPNLAYRWYIVPSLSGILSMFVALVITALSIARERELGTFDQLLVSPATPAEIIVAKTVPALVIGTVLGNVMVAAGATRIGASAGVKILQEAGGQARGTGNPGATARAAGE
jgi:ABC-2 type transport system permease protein